MRQRTRPEPAVAVPTFPATEDLLVQLFNARLATPAGLVPGEIWMQHGKLVDPQSRFWGRATRAADRRVDCEGCIIAPGAAPRLRFALPRRSRDRIVRTQASSTCTCTMCSECAPTRAFRTPPIVRRGGRQTTGPWPGRVADATSCVPSCPRLGSRPSAPPCAACTTRARTLGCARPSARARRSVRRLSSECTSMARFVRRCTTRPRRVASHT